MAHRSGKIPTTLLVLAALVAAAAIALWLYTDQVAQTVIERGGSAKLGVPVRLDQVDVGITARELRFENLRIANPEGFEAEHILTIGEGGLEVADGTLFAQTLRVPELHLADIDLVLASADGERNYAVLMDRLGGEDDGQPAETDRREGPRLTIDRLVLEDITVDSSLLPIPTPTVTIDRITAEDLSDRMSTGEVASLVLRLLLEEVAKEGAGLPLELVEDLEQEVGELENLIAGGIDRALGGEDDGQAR